MLVNISLNLVRDSLGGIPVAFVEFVSVSVSVGYVARPLLTLMQQDEKVRINDGAGAVP